MVESTEITHQLGSEWQSALTPVSVLVVFELSIFLKILSDMLVMIRFLVQLQKSLALESEKFKF